MSEMRIAKRFPFLLAAAALALAPPSCGFLLKEVFRPPKVRVVDVALTSSPAVSRGAPWEFTLSLAVDNPNGYALNVSRVAYCAIIGRETVAEGERTDDIRIGPSGVTVVKVPVALRPDALSAALRRVLSARSLSYEFNGSVGLRTPVGGAVRIPFSKTGELDPVELLKKKGFGLN